MANRYWVGGTANWDGTAGTKWAATSNGSGGETVPTTADDVFFDQYSTGTITIQTGNTGAKSIDCTGFTGTLTGSIAMSLSGDLKLVSGMTYTYTGLITIGANSTITSAGKTLGSINQNVANTTVSLGDALTCSRLTLTRGTFNASNYNVTCNDFQSANSNIRTLTMGSGLWTITGAGSCWNVVATNLTFNKDTADILLSNNSTSARTFTSGTLTYNKITIGGTTSTSTTTFATGAMSCSELASTKTVAHTIQFSANHATITKWTVSGTSGNVVTFNSSVAGTQRTFTLTDETSAIDYLSVKDISEVNGSKFYVGSNSTDGGNNSNVYFSSASSTTKSGNMFLLFA